MNTLTGTCAASPLHCSESGPPLNADEGSPSESLSERDGAAVWSARSCHGNRTRTPHPFTACTAVWSHEDTVTVPGRCCAYSSLAATRGDLWTRRWSLYIQSSRRVWSHADTAPSLSCYVVTRAYPWMGHPVTVCAVVSPRGRGACHCMYRHQWVHVVTPGHGTPVIAHTLVMWTRRLVTLCTAVAWSRRDGARWPGVQSS